MLCRKCGKEISDDSDFCVYCGEKTGNVVSGNDYKNQNAYSNNSSWNNAYANPQPYNNPQTYDNGNINDKINAYNTQITRKKELNKKLVVILGIAAALVVTILVLVNSKFGAYNIGKWAMGSKNYSLAADRFKAASGYANADEYYSYIKGEDEYNKGNYDSAYNYYKKIISKVRNKPNQYKELNAKEISDKMNYGICKKYEEQFNAGKLYDAYKTLYDVDDDYVYNGVSVHSKMQELYSLKNYIEMIKDRAEINPSNRFMSGWYNNSIGAKISISKITDGVLYIDYYLPYISKYSSYQSGLKHDTLEGTVMVAANDCNKWLNVDKYYSDGLKINVSNINRKISMYFGYSAVFTSYGDVLGGSTKGDYEAQCTTYISNFMKNGWVGDFYYENGTKKKNAWAEYGKDWYYLGNEGWYVTDSWVDNNEYYVGKDGKMLKDTKAPDGTKLDKNGKRIK